ncbi:MAG: hypothetical protein QME51_10810 [Planctomycetota bacterium]|nr:hypothetical protein [Planctomycetota bacterium]
MGFNPVVAVTNFIRLLDLTAEIQEDVRRQTLSVGHGLAILSVPNPELRLKLWQRVKNEDRSVRHLRIIVDAYLHPRGISIDVGRATSYKEFHCGNDPNLREWAKPLRQKLGPNANVSIHCCKIGDKFIFGTISIACHSEADIQHILKIIGYAPLSFGVLPPAISPPLMGG